MKINPVPNPNVISSYRSGKIRSEGTEKVGGGLDQVSFSKEALSFSKTLSGLKENVRIESRTPEETDRIAELKDRIKNGTYNVKSEDVAEKMLRDILS